MKKTKNTCYAILFFASVLVLGSCGSIGDQKEPSLLDSARIVSVNGTASEILAGLGLENKIVGVDVASTYPGSLAGIPRIGHSRKLSPEGILALNPTLVIGTRQDINPELSGLLTSAGVKTLLFEQNFSVEGSKQLIRSMADSLGLSTGGDSIIHALEADLEKVAVSRPRETKRKVLFIYARGTGTMMVAGDGTPVQKVIELAGAENAVKGFKDYKPLTAEALVAADPDVILLFDSGLKSLGGIEGLLEVQGVKETKAGKNRKVIEMDGQFLTGFSPRLGKALQELSTKIYE
ncbi:hemin ABC transporter substrate-binding protein [Sphingobacterium sp. JB170]|uniref:heme/hemin ABC transporter substrate-binding protein n=1 Tax=Sphingobacterium sp. JB170 TaxID=1434842 RepID=UPI00097F252B|nr:ABC transporter substrate-binding protein [Sphingobacterium sp. JB170]SJN22678.1 Heme ABC transporter, cell surface heme and hemoprotein receptor HmuT [Sphingobacterium sp. JB170]